MVSSCGAGTAVKWARVCKAEQSCARRMQSDEVSAGGDAEGRWRLQLAGRACAFLSRAICFLGHLFLFAGPFSVGYLFFAVGSFFMGYLFLSWSPFFIAYMHAHHQHVQLQQQRPTCSPLIPIHLPRWHYNAPPPASLDFCSGGGGHRFRPALRARGGDVRGALPVHPQPRAEGEAGVLESYVSGMFLAAI